MLSLPELSVAAGSISVLVVANIVAPRHWLRRWFVALAIGVPAAVAGALNLACAEGIEFLSRWPWVMLMAGISGFLQWLFLALLRQTLVYDHGREPILTTGVVKLEATAEDRPLSIIFMAICLGTTLSAVVLCSWVC